MSTQFATEPYTTAPEAERDQERRALESRLTGQYQVVRELGRGGMGVVFLARDVALHRSVAIKVLRHEYVNSAHHRERFRREARMTARLGHAGIVPVFALSERDDFVYMVMKYVHGESLAERLRREHMLTPREASRILRDLSSALEHAHAEGMVHRDLKAENVLIEKKTGRAYLTDFGVAFVPGGDSDEWEQSHAMGTPHYMSPEQAAGEADLDGRSDLYSLGVLGYQMLSGRLPFDGPSFESLAAQHIVKAHEPLAALTPSAPAELVAAIEKCLAKDREARWQDAGELRRALVDGARHSRQRQVFGWRGWMRVVAGVVVVGWMGR